MIFISIPKNASSSIQAVLGSKKYNHMASHKVPDDQPKFAVIRNPFDRLVSWFVYHKSVDAGKMYNTDFTGWVKDGYPHHWNKRVCKSMGIKNPLNQHEFVDDSVILITFDNMHSEINLMLRAHGKKPVSIPHIMPTNRKATDTYYTNETRGLVIQRFAEDFGLYERSKLQPKG